MNNLEVTDAKAKKLGELEDLSIETIRNALTETIPADAETVKVAVKTLSMVARNRQTMTNRSAIECGMATRIATPEEMRKYVANTTPHVIKALTGS